MLAGMQRRSTFGLPAPVSGGALAFTLALPLMNCAAEAPGRRPPAAPAVAVPIPAPEGTTSAQRPPDPACEDEAFTSVWPRLRAHLEAGIEGLVPLIDPDRGVFVIDNPGAFVVPMHFRSLAEAGTRVPALVPEHFGVRCPEHRTDATPQFSCETEEWSTAGCVLTPNPDFSVARWYDIALKYDVLPAAEAEAGLQRARPTDAAITHGVYVTDSPIGFYFGRVGCIWRILAIDTVTPCSA